MTHSALVRIAAFGVLSIYFSATSAQQPAPAWSGLWRDSTGGSMTVLEREGLLEVRGHDRASAFSLVCVLDRVDKSKAECVGDGLNHEGSAVFKFTYRSSWVRVGADSFTEQWQARYAQGDLAGKATFERARVK